MTDCSTVSGVFVVLIYKKMHNFKVIFLTDHTIFWQQEIKKHHAILIKKNSPHLTEFVILLVKIP